MADGTQTEVTTTEKLLALARERLKIVDEAEEHIREASLEDIRFTYNIEEGQWPQEIRSERSQDNRPCLTANKLRKYVANVANQERENRVAVQVRPVDDKSDPQIARIYEDLVRQIEFTSDADQIYASAGEQAAAGGFGYFRIFTKIPDDGFDQEIYMSHIENQFAVHMDPRGNYCFISDWMPRADFEAMYPKAETVDFNDWNTGTEWEGWYEQDKIRIAEYYSKESYDRELIQVKNKETQELMVFDLTDRDDLTKEILVERGFEVIQERTAQATKVVWRKITGNEILEERDIPSRDIPVVEVVGDKVNISGKNYKRSLIRDGKDSQRMYNYWLTTETETVALAPKAPYLVTPQEIKGHENQWADANRKNLPYLLFNAQGQRVPQRQAPPQTSPGHREMMDLADRDISDTLGIYESALGEQGNERSGRAIIARTQRSQVGTLHFPDNLRRAVIAAGKILIDMIPKVYDTERTIRIRGENGEEELIQINHTYKDMDTGKDETINDLNVGKYDVRADVRLYSTRRQEASEGILQAMQYAPMFAPYIADLLFKFLDSPGADEVRERMQMFLANQAQEQAGDGQGGKNGTGGPGGPIPPAGVNAGELNGA